VAALRAGSSAAGRGPAGALPEEEGSELELLPAERFRAVRVSLSAVQARAGARRSWPLVD